jgi:hypothetical protein
MASADVISVATEQMNKEENGKGESEGERKKETVIVLVIAWNHSVLAYGPMGMSTVDSKEF